MASFGKSHEMDRRDIRGEKREPDDGPFQRAASRNRSSRDPNRSICAGAQSRPTTQPDNCGQVNRDNRNIKQPHCWPTEIGPQVATCAVFLRC